MKLCNHKNRFSNITASNENYAKSYWDIQTCKFKKNYKVVSKINFQL